MTPVGTSRAILAGLRSLDPAPPGPLTARQASRAEATLTAILATDPTPEQGQRTERTTRRRTSRGRWAALAGMAVIGAVLIDVIPGSPGSGDPAFATWKAVPVRLTLDPSGETARGCRDHGADHTDAATQAAAAKATVAIAERRGIWTFVLLAGADGFGISCLTDRTFDDSAFGSAGAPMGYRPPSSREIRLSNCCGGGGTVRNGVKSLIGEVEGFAGADVAGIVVLTPAKGPVEATIGHGRFAAWWPDNDSDSRPQMPMTFEVTFTDGSRQRVTLAP